MINLKFNLVNFNELEDLTFLVPTDCDTICSFITNYPAALHFAIIFRVSTKLSAVCYELGWSMHLQSYPEDNSRMKDCYLNLSAG